MGLRSVSVAYLGPRASYTHQAALAAFPLDTGVIHKPLATIPAVFAAVRSGGAKYGVIPFYNTTQGSVAATLDCLTDNIREVPIGHSSELKVRKEVRLPIRHSLLGWAKCSTTEDSLSSIYTQIQTVLSHEQALGQCSNFLDSHIPHAERVVVSSTSRAAEMVSEDRNITSVAAISSHMAADEYRVPVIQDNIQDRDDNATRFIVISQTVNGEPTFGNVPGSGKRTSLIVFTVSHSAAGALVRALMVLMRHSLNLTGIHQRPPNETRRDDAIFIEVEGEVNDGVMQDLKKETLAVELLGTWMDPSNSSIQNQI